MTEDVPFGAVEEKPQTKKVVVIGVVVVVLAIVAAVVSQYVMPKSHASFSVDTSNSESVQAQAQGDEAHANKTESLIYVHVIGCVKTPGVVGVAKDARLIDAINAAGGFLENASSESLNLARTVNDGEQIRVLSKEEQEAQNAAAAAASGGSGSGGSAAGSAAGAASLGTSAIDSEGRVNINTANEAELCTISGVGESTAKKIIAEREANGPFASVDDITRVSGIGEKKLASMRDSICV